MNTLAWFFFKLLVFGYVEDLDTGMAFRLPGGLSWRIFLEVLYTCCSAQSNPKQPSCEKCVVPKKVMMKNDVKSKLAAGEWL